MLRAPSLDAPQESAASRAIERAPDADTFERVRPGQAGLLSAFDGRPKPPLSRIGAQVERALRIWHPLGKGSTWNLSGGNQLVGQGGRPWIVQSPPAGGKLEPGHSDFLHREVFDTLAGAKRSINLATLASPDGAYLDTINQGLKAAAARRGPNDPALDARILIGSVQAKEGSQVALQTMLDRITRDLPADARIRVSIGTYAGQADSPLSFSHAKIVSADGDDALVGGHNWWSNEYNVDQNPVYDLSMRARGPAAKHADEFFNSLFGYARSFGTVVTREARDQDGKPIPIAPPGPSLPPPPGKGSTIISVGSTGGVSLNASGASDTALFAMIDAANKSVRISGQDLVSMELGDKQPVLFGVKLPVTVHLDQHLSEPLLDHLGQAMLRGVKVEIGLSTDAKGGYSHGWSIERTRKAILDHVHRMAPPGRDLAELDKNLDLRGLYTADGKPIRNHAKMLAVDDAAFYVGSQNFYPGGMKELKFTQLAEHGYIVDDAKATQQLMRDYWEPLWRNAR